MSQNYPLGLVEYWDKLDSTHSDNITSIQTYKTFLITGINISSRKPCSRFISEATVKMLHTQDENLFNKLAERYLTPKQQDTDNIEKWASSICHNVRNVDSNRRKRQFKNLLV